MDSITNIIISGIVYDLLKKGVELTFQQVFGGFYGKGIYENMDIYTDFLSEINNQKELKNKENIVQDILSDSKLYESQFERDLYNTNFAKRLDYIIFIINKSRKNEKKINIEYLGEFLGFSSVNELMKYYKNDEEPSYKFCEEIACKLGVSAEWLKNGEFGQNIFTTTLPIIYDAKKILENMEKKDYCEIKFVISEDESRRRILIARKYNELKYEYYPCEFVFNSCVGGTGNSQLLSLYNFLHDFRNNGGNIFEVYGVTKEIFYEILDGKTYCGSIEKYPLKGQLNILDDFLDVKHKYYRTEEYEEMYGADFLEIQKIVERGLEEMKMN